MLAEVLLKIAAEEAKQRDAEYFKQYGKTRTKYYSRPSSAGPEKCIRQMVFHSLDIATDKPMDDRMWMVFDDGHWHEELTMDWIRKSVFQLHSEQMVVKCRPPMTFGHIDGILTIPRELTPELTEPIDVLWEHKALNHFTFQRYWESNELFLVLFPSSLPRLKRG